MKKSILAAGALISSALLAAVLAPHASASTYTSVLDKAQLQGMHVCQKNFKNEYTYKEITEKNIVGISSREGSFDIAMPTNKSSMDPFAFQPINGKFDGSIGTMKWSSYSCQQIFYGEGQSQSYHKRYFGKDLNDSSKDFAFLKDAFGYTPNTNGSSSGKPCYTYSVAIEFNAYQEGGFIENATLATGVMKSRHYCFSVNDNTVTGLEINNLGDDEGKPFETKIFKDPSMAEFKYDSSSMSFSYPTDDQGNSKKTESIKGKTVGDAAAIVKKALSGYIDAAKMTGYLDQPAHLRCRDNNGDTNDSAQNSRGGYAEFCVYNASKLKPYNIDAGKSVPEGTKFWHWGLMSGSTVTEASKTGNTNSAASYNKYEITDKSEWRLVKLATKTKTDDEAKKKTYLTKTEKILLYQIYLVQVLDNKVTCNPESKGGVEVKFFPTGSTKPEQCRIIGTPRDDTRKMHAVDNAGNIQNNVGIDAAGIIDFLNGLSDDTTLDYPSDVGSEYEDVNTTDPEAGNAGGGSGNKEVSCYDTAGNSNWLVCPIIDNNKGAAKMLYGFIEGMLQVNTKLFTPNEKGINGTLIAWESFRNIANVVFIIVFVIVILSQITGLGVDNYGIKKILPKLILGALLVNISYYICQACVDVANITGGGVKGILQSAADQMKGTKELKVQFDGIHAQSIGMKWTAAILIAGIAVAAVAVSGGSLLVPLVVGVVGVAIGLLFFATLLAVRQGLAVILVVISPMAFTAYMLPNTKTLFTKWVKVFSSVLLAYPICAFALYGGELTSNIILMAQAGTGGNVITNFPLALTSAIVSIAPVFFVPGLITKSMSGIAAASNRVQKGVSALAKGGTHRALTPITEENAKRVKATRADNWMKKHKNDTHRTKLGDLYHRYRMRSGISKVSAYEGESAKIYDAQMKGMNVKSLTDMAGESFDENGKFDDVKFGAAIRQLNATGNDEVALEQIEKMSENIDKMKPEELEKFKSIVAQQGTLGKAYAKLLGKRQASSTPKPLLNFKDALNSGAEINDIMKDLGKNALAGMSKDEMDYLDTNFASAVSGNLFTEEQYTTAAAAHTGSAAEKFLNLLNKSGHANAVRSGLSDTAFAGMDDKLRHDLFNGYRTEYDRRVDNLAQSGDKAVIASATGSLKADLDTEVASRAAAERVRAADAAQAAKDTVDVLNDIKSKM